MALTTSSMPSVDTFIDSLMPTAQQRLAWPCTLPPEAPRQAHSAYLRAVVSALGPHAGSVEWDHSLAGTGLDGEEVATESVPLVSLTPSAGREGSSYAASGCVRRDACC